MKKTRSRWVFLTVIMLLACAFLTYASSENWWRFTPEKPKDPKSELKNLMSDLLNRNSLDMAGTIRLYDRENGDQLKEESSFIFIRNGKRFISRLDYLQQFGNDSMVIQLDTINKTVTVTRTAFSGIASEAGVFPFEKYISDSADFRIVVTATDKGKESVLELRSDFTPDIKLTRISYDPVTYLMKSAEIEWWKDPLFREEKDEKKCWLTKIDYTYRKSVSVNIDSLIGSVIEIQPELRLRDSYKGYYLNIGSK